MQAKYLILFVFFTLTIVMLSEGVVGQRDNEKTCFSISCMRKRSPQDRSILQNLHTNKMILNLINR